ncbi:MAG: response regulator [Myxococcaceae bacterium]|nr:response regulator [Myxococcaceae bacterium]
MATRVRAFDWSKTPLGPMDRWPRALQNMVGVALHARQLMVITWGPRLTMIYNDYYRAALGGRHPAGLGQPYADVWAETMPLMRPQLDDALVHGKSSAHESQRVLMLRHGRLEETYWTYGISPLFDDDGSIGGTLGVGLETTVRVLLTRRQQMLYRVSDSAALALTPDEVVQRALNCLAGFVDVPMALVYSFERGRSWPRLVGHTEMPEAVREKLNARFGKLTPEVLVSEMRRGPISLAGSVADALDVNEGVVMPLSGASSGQASGYAVLGLNGMLFYDEPYRLFLEQLTARLSVAQARLDARRAREMFERERNDLMMQAPVAIALMTGPDLIFGFANTPYRQMVGLHRELLNRPFFEALPETVNTPTQEMLKTAFETGQPFRSTEWKAEIDRHGDGKLEEAYYDFAVNPTRDMHGDITGLLVVAVESTQQVKGRQAMERTQAEREKWVAALEEANRAKDEFLAMLGHELRNPLAPMVTALALMRTRGSMVFEKERGIIEHQVEHLSRLLDDLLDAAKIARGKIELRKETVDVSEVMHQAVGFASMLLEKRQQHLELNVPRGLRWRADPVRLAQAVSNLLTNSARYTPVGGNIALDAHEQAGQLQIKVRDDGMGISSDVMPRIFDMFFQGKRANERTEGGLGLGLTLVHNLVGLHKGTVEAKSGGPGLGSEFTITLPVPSAPLKPAATADAEVTLAPAPAHRKVLVVDDNADAAEMIKEVLEDQGYQVEVAFNPLAALDIASHFSPDVAVLDIGLPVMDGYELGNKLREQHPGSDVRLIALTGYGQLHDRTRSKDAGFAAHMVKPVNLSQLVKLIAR